MKRKLVALMLACILLLAAIACQNAADEKGGDTADSFNVNNNQNESDSTEAEENNHAGGTLIIGVNQDLQQPLWFNVRQVTDFYYTNCFLEPLLQLDEKGDPQPYLCESFTADVDNLKYIIDLKQGIIFHDGTQLTADVCKWNLDLYKERGVLSSSFLKNVESFEVTGDYQVTIHMSSWDSTLPYGLARAAGFMCSQDAYEKMGEEAFEKAPVGTGPFKFDSREYDVSVTFTKYENYWQGEPLLDEVKFVIYGSDAVAQAALEVGDVHVIFPESLDVAAALESKGFKLVKTAVPAQSSSFGIECNNEESPLHDIRVRQAVCYAIDRNAVIEATYGSNATVSTQYALPGTTYYNDEITNYEYNPEKAKQLLAEAGYADGFKTKIWTYNTATLEIKACQVIAQQLAEVGIDCEIEITDVAAYIVGIDGWGDGFLYHAMTLSNGVPSIINANFVQGLKSGLGVQSFLHPDDLNEIVIKGASSTGEDSIEAFKTAQKMIFEEYCMLKYIGSVFKCTVRSPKVMDSTIGEVAYAVPGSWTMWKAWISE